MVALPYSLISWFFSSLKCHSHNLGNISLDEDVLKTSFVFVFRRCLQDVLIKTNIFALVIRLQDVLIKTNIFVLVIRLQDVFKMSSRRLQDVLPRRLQDVLKASSRRLAKTSSRHLAKTSSRRLRDIFQRSCKDAFKMFWRRIIRLNCLPSSRICLGHTSEKFMVSVENLQVW